MREIYDINFSCKKMREKQKRKNILSRIKFFCPLETGKTPLYCLIVNKYYIG